MPDIVSIIPARGRSKGVPQKNIKLLNNKPLIYYTIKEALKSKLDRIIVSTEDDEIAEISRTYGAEVIKRPKELANDDTPTIDVIFQVLGFLERNERYVPSIIVLLQPTSPLRNSRDINEAIGNFINNKCESLVSVCEVEHPPFWYLKINSKGFLQPFVENSYSYKRHQDLPKIYRPNGAIFIAKPEILYKYRTFYCARAIPYFMSQERSVDIDSAVDFKLAEILMQKAHRVYRSTKN